MEEGVEGLRMVRVFRDKVGRVDLGALEACHVRDFCICLNLVYKFYNSIHGSYSIDCRWGIMELLHYFQYGI